MTNKTDRQLQLDVMAELDWDPSIDAARVGVEVHNGIVTLSGQIDSYAEKWAAEIAAQRVTGVKGLVMDLTVILPGSAIRTDEDVARQAKSALDWSISVPKDAVKVRVEDGWVTLTGQVDWAYARDTAAMCVRGLVGIKGVINNVHVRPRATAKDVKTTIEAALQRRAHFDTKAITVDVDGSTVILSGVVDSLGERHTVENAVWNAPGVSSVVDKLAIA
ncbi:MAG: BON domain-containing protein [Rhodanobacteraceae bacterium]